MQQSRHRPIAIKRQEERKMHDMPSTNAQFDSFLETLAKLIEAKAATVIEAAQLVREAKTTNNK